MKKQYSIKVNGKNYFLDKRTWIMGVLNITPDSFSDGGLYYEKSKAIEHGLKLVAEGADIIDIGGESTRPGSEPISAKKELRRVIPIISALREKTDILISIDTTKSEVAREALDAGANIINDISSFRFDPEMGPLAAQKDVPVVLMHMKGTPRTMQLNPWYEDLLAEVKSFLRERIETAQSYGIKKGNIIIDPGIGFGKKFEDNLILINKLSFLEDLECPVLVGISRKSFIGKILNLPPLERLEGTIASAVVSVIKGAHILRVHDVHAIKKAVLVVEAILEESFYPNLKKENQEKYVC